MKRTALALALLPLLAAAACDSNETPATTTAPLAPAVATAAPKPAPPPPPPAPAAPAPAADPSAPPPGMPIAADDPAHGVFTLAQAVAGLPAKGDLWADIDIEQGGKKLGTLSCKLYSDKAPYNVANFVGLARGLRPWKAPKTGLWVKEPFFDGLIFHRVIPQFMVQGGDPVGTGIGDAGYVTPDEWQNGLTFDRPGLMAMANKGMPFTAGTQFFITEVPTPFLNGKYSIFGECSPTDLVKAMARVPVDSPMHNMPLTKVVMSKVTIVRK